MSTRNGAWGLIATMVATFVLLRTWLSLSPDADFNVGPYNIHHLFTGLVLVTLGGVPLAVLKQPHRAHGPATVVFGAGLAMALDEWVYLIVTDGTNASYLLPVSFWGGGIAVGLGCLYAVALALVNRDR